MSFDGQLITVALVALAIGALIFLALFGRPWRHPDPVMSWHLVSIAAIAGLEALGLLLIMILGLLPLVFIYWGGVAVMYWRIALLLYARKKDHEQVP